ncbi:hypothetical protein PG994_010973 [Apiospora phragmitis]|uniref:Uncharacterized protein n=1 Tax=Apiospora phragmitis TaxID=2905665 RepID=A0ABR1TRH7_9PEZI
MAPLAASRLKRDLINYRLQCWFANATYTKTSEGASAAFSFDHTPQQPSQDVVFLSTENTEWYLRVNLYDELQTDSLEPSTRQHLDESYHDLKETVRRDPEAAMALDGLLDQDIEDLSLSGLLDIQPLAGLSRTEKIRLLAQYELSVGNNEDKFPTPPWSKENDGNTTGCWGGSGK